MKKFYTIPFVAVALLVTACNTENDIDETVGTQEETERAGINDSPAQPNVSFFPTPDSSTELAKLDHSTALYRCVSKASEDLGAQLNDGMATEEEIKFLTTEVETILTKAKATTETQKLNAIYNWVRTNIKYSYDVTQHSAYYTYTGKKGICQGYSNLLNVMCHIAGISCFNGNGYATSSWLGHAWNYAKADGKWYVVDATHSRKHPLSSLSSYKNYYFPMQIDVTLFEDDNFKYTWYDGNFAITEVKQGNAQLTIPYSVNSLRISSFNPLTAIPSNVETIYLGDNIVHLGNTNDYGAYKQGASVEAIHIVESNPTFCSENGIVYRRNGDEVQLTIVPAAMRWVELSSKLTKLEKNAISGHNAVETLVIPASVKTIESWAVENAPNLLLIYVPEECTYLGYDDNFNTVTSSEPTTNTFVGINPNCQIIKGSVPSSIKPVTL